MGTPYAIKYNGTLYYYITNLQGDILHIVDASGATVVSYTYSPYGKVLSTTGTLASTLGVDNPLRYRGYYYDTDSGLYYLQSRYYDPELGRFINADGYPSTGQGIIGNNMFAYCGSNPISRLDDGGEFWDTVFDLISIATDIVDIAVNPGNVIAWGALAADVASLVVPGLTGGGKIVRVVANSDEVLDAAKYADEIFDGAKQFFSKSDIGQLMHKGYDPLQDAGGQIEKLCNQPLTKYGSKLRPDFVDFDNRVIYELKPFNKNAFKRAAKQVQKYAEVLGGEWTVVIDMYVR